MSVHTPHGSVRYRLPWSWAAFDYRELCRLLFQQCDARFEIATVRGRRGARRAHRPRRLTAPLVVDALGWRRVLAGATATSRPRRRCRAASRYTPTAAAPTSTSGSTARWCVMATAGASRREPSSGWGWAPTSRATTSSSPTVELASRLRREPVRYQGNWFPHRLRRAAEGGVFFVGDSAGHCFPLSGEGIRTAFYFGIACGRS